MFTFVEMHTFDLSIYYHSINTFNYTWFENLWKHTWIRLLKLTLSSYKKPQSKNVNHVSNVINHNPFKTFGPSTRCLLWLWMYWWVVTNYKPNLHRCVQNFKPWSKIYARFFPCLPPHVKISQPSNTLLDLNLYSFHNT